MTFQVLGLDHVVLRVRDIERALSFYRDVLGCALERRQNADTGRGRCAMSEPSVVRVPSGRHVALLDVVSNILL